MVSLDRETLVRTLRALRPEFERMGVTHVALFGSRARRDNRPDSDIDLLIDVADDLDFSLLDLIGVGHQIEDRLHLPANLFMRRSLDPTFAQTTRRDQVQVF